MRASPQFWIVLFGIAAVAQCLAFYLLPVLVPIFTGALVVVIGVIAMSASIAAFGRTPSWAAAIAFLVSLAIGLAWFLIPTRHVSEVVRFKVKEPSFKEVIAQWQRGSKPSCIQTQECIVDSKEPDRQGLLIRRSQLDRRLVEMSPATQLRWRKVFFCADFIELTSDSSESLWQRAAVGQIRALAVLK